MFDLGFQELVVIFAIAIVVFGPKRLPELSRNLGRAVGHIKKAIFDVKYEINREMRVMEDGEEGTGAGLDAKEDGEQKWRKEALEAIYGGKKPPAGGAQGPGDTLDDDDTATDQESSPSVSGSPDDLTHSPDDSTEGDDKGGHSA